MARAWLFSSVLHVALAALMYFGLPSLSRPRPVMEQAITVELVDEAAELKPEPPAPAPAATAPKPAQRAAAPNPTPPSPPEPRVEPEPAPEPPQAEAKPEPAPPPPPAVEPPPEPAVAEPPPPQPEPAPKPDAAPAEPAPEPPAKPEFAETKPEPPPPAPEAQPKPEPAPEPKVAALQPETEPEPTPVAKAEPPPPAREPPVRKPLLKPPAPKVAETPPPAPKPEPAAPKEDAFAALLRSVEKLDRQVESETTRAGTGRGAATDGRARDAIGEAPLSFSEIDALRRQIGSCWTLPVGVEGIDDMVVQLRIEVRPDRTVQNVAIEDQARLGRDPTFRAVAESARRAVDKCSPLTLPPGKYALWRDIAAELPPRGRDQRLIRRMSWTPLLRLGCLVLGGLLLPAPARAVLELDITQGIVEPLPIAISELYGADPGRGAARPGDRRRGQRRSRALRAVPADRPPRVHPVARASCAACRASPTGARSTPRRWSPARSTGGEAGGELGGRVPALGRVRRHPDARPALCHHDRQLAARRPPDRRCGLRADHRRGRYFDTRIVYVSESGPRDRPRQARRDHGPGRRQSPLPDRRRRSGADPALPPGRQPDRLHASIGGRVPQVYLLERDPRPAAEARRLRRHDLRAASSAPTAGWSRCRSPRAAIPTSTRLDLETTAAAAADRPSRRSTPRRRSRPTAGAWCSTPIAPARRSST